MPGQLSPLGQRIDRRRAELGLKLKDVADAAGLSVEVLRAVRYGENRPRGTTLAALDRALRWKSGSAQDFVTAGTEPVPLDGPLRGHGHAPATAEDAERQAVIDGVNALYPGDGVAEAIMTQWHKPLDVRTRELDEWRARQSAARA